MAKNKEYKAGYLKDLDTSPFDPIDEIWINTPQIQQDIAIQN